MSDREDEVWTTKDGREIEVGNMTEAHAKNALRMVLRKRRKTLLILVDALAAFSPLESPVAGCDEYGSLEKG